MHRYTTKEAAVVLGFSESTLRHWRQGSKEWKPGLGPHFYSINGRIYYSSAALTLWLRLHASDIGFVGQEASEMLAGI